MTLGDVSTHVGVSAEELERWEGELSCPSLGQLERLAGFYGREIDYFLKQTPAPPSGVAFRGAHGRSLMTLDRQARVTLAKFEELCRTEFEFENLLGKEQAVALPHFPGSETPKNAAVSVRRVLDASQRPLADSRPLLEEKGVRIFELKVSPPDAFSGFSFWHQEYGPCVLINAGDPKGRRNFTLAHELAHLVFGHGSSVCSIQTESTAPSGRQERKANVFAAELLMPETSVEADFLRRGFPTQPTPSQLSAMASKWVVSVQALGYRLEQLGLIEGGYTDKLREAEPVHFRRPRTPAWERQRGKRFVHTSLEAYRRHMISIGKLADSLGVPIRTALQIAEQGES